MERDLLTVRKHEDLAESEERRLLGRLIPCHCSTYTYHFFLAVRYYQLVFAATHFVGDSFLPRSQQPHIVLIFFYLLLSSLYRIVSPIRH